MPQRFAADQTSQHGREFESKDGHPKTTPPRIYAANDLIDRPDQETTCHNYVQSSTEISCRGRDPPKHCRNDYDPQYEVGCLGDGDRTCPMISEKPR
jgi:hypothetical protein